MHFWGNVAFTQRLSDASNVERLAIFGIHALGFLLDDSDDEPEQSYEVLEDGNHPKALLVGSTHQSSPVKFHPENSIEQGMSPISSPTPYKGLSSLDLK